MNEAKLPQSTRPAPAWSRRARMTTEAKTAASDPSRAADSTTQTPPAADNGCPSQPPSHREVFLGHECYPNARAHWFIFIPSLTHQNIGKVIQVVGNPHSGFGFQVKMNCDPVASRYHPGESGAGTTRFIKLGEVPSFLIVDGYTPRPGYAPEYRSTPLPGDATEQAAYELGLPYREPGAVLPPVGDPVWRENVPGFERCQEWCARLVRRLVELGYFEENAISALGEATSFGI